VGTFRQGPILADFSSSLRSKYVLDLAQRLLTVVANDRKGIAVAERGSAPKISDCFTFCGRATTLHRAIPGV
jgi:hypothetical protein